MITKDIDIFGGTERPILKMSTDPDSPFSAIYLDKDDDLVFPVQRFFRLAWHFNPEIKNSLMIGGAAYSFPKDYLKTDSMAKMDVVEIDPTITKIAREYFNLRDDPRLNIYHEDGRTFLNKTQNKYDAVFMDAYKTHFVPYQLTTIEAAEEIYRVLNDNGVALVNIISSIEGDKGKFLRAEYATFKQIFPQVYIFRVLYPMPEITQNLMLVAIKSDKPASFTDSNEELNAYLTHIWDKEIPADVPVLTDDYAPVDNYMLKVFE
jgi:spermidine synthase